MSVLHDTEIDGVRCFWVETGRPTLAARLEFRAGMVDERLTTAGWLHLVEHLCLHGRSGGVLDVNGSVGVLHTAFDAHGTPSDVAAHLAHVAGWLEDPDVSELEHERRVLGAEADLRAGGISANALGQRYGAAGPGLATYGDMGLGRATSELLQAHVGRFFTRGNAVLMLDGPPPAGLRLPLPEGDLVAPPPAVPCETDLPAAYGEPGGLVLSGVVERGSGSTYVAQLLENALTARLRDEAGAAYAPWSHYEPVDSDHAVVLAGSDVTEHLQAEVVDIVLGLVGDLAREGVDRAALDLLVEKRIQMVRDPYAAFGLALRAGHDWFDGRPTLDLEEVVAESRVSPERLSPVAAQVASSLLLGVPGGVAWSDQLRVLTMEDAGGRPDGRHFRSRNWPADRERLTVGDHYVQVTDEVLARRIAVQDVVGYVVHDGGGRVVVREDGYQIRLQPDDWRGGQRAVTALDDLVPLDLHLPLPGPDRVPAKPVLPSWRVWVQWLRDARARHATGLLVVLLLGLAMVAFVVDGVFSGGFILAAFLVWRSRRRDHD